MDAKKVKENARLFLSKIVAMITFALEMLVFYAPIAWTKFIEYTTFYIPLRSHLAPIRIKDNHYALITSTNMGDRGRYLINIFYKRYSPYDIRDFTALRKKYMPVYSLKFNVDLFSTDSQCDNEIANRRYTVEFSHDGAVKVNDKSVELQLYSADLNAILNQPVQEKLEGKID